MQDLFRPIAHFQLVKEFEALFYRAVEASVSPATLNDFKIVAESVHDDMNFYEYEKIVKVILKVLTDNSTKVVCLVSGMCTTLSKRRNTVKRRR